MPFYLAVKEILYSKGRFALIGMIVALITVLVLFVAALAEGLGAGNKEFLENLSGELLVFQENVDISINASRLGRSRLNEIRRVEGVEDAGQVSFSSATLIFTGNAGGDPQEPLDVSLIGVEPSYPGEPATVQGVPLSRNRANEAIIGGNVAKRRDVGVGDQITVKAVQGTSEEFYDLIVVGIAEGQQYSIQPSVIVPYLTWDKVRPQSTSENNSGELISNIIVVKLTNPLDTQTTIDQLQRQVDSIEVVDRRTAYESTPGYSAQQSTLNTQRYFTLFIGILVIGGFFQIQTLQKVAQIGMLKAIGASNRTVAIASAFQIVTINALGVLVGVAGAVGLSLSFPPEVPILFTSGSLTSAITSLLLIGPMGGLISVWILLKVEPLTALGLAQ